VLAGAIGNLIDRINLGYVIDFIALHYQNWYFPVFNVADVCITIGAIILIADSLFFSDN
jgi:signal peptidase II